MYFMSTSHCSSESVPIAASMSDAEAMHLQTSSVAASLTAAVRVAYGGSASESASAFTGSAEGPRRSRGSHSASRALIAAVSAASSPCTNDDFHSSSSLMVWAGEFAPPPRR